MVLNILVAIAGIVVVIASISAWLNTETIIRELTEIKAKLESQEANNQSKTGS